MKIFALIAIVAVIFFSSSPVSGVSGGRTLRGINKEINENVNVNFKEIGRILDQEGKEDSEDVYESDDEDYVPIVSENCADTDGLIKVADNQLLNCRKIRKSKLCDREYNGKILSESCEKSCGICLEVIPTTDAPTADLIELVLTDLPADDSHESYAPSYQPTVKETEEPTEEPSHYPTPLPTDNIMEELFDGLDDDAILELLDMF